MISASLITMILGDITSIVLLVSPGHMFLQMIMRQSVNEDFNILPYVASLSNCVLWVLYQSVHPGNILVLMINIVGIGIQVSYLGITFSFGRRRMQISILKMLAVEFILMGIFMACVFAGVHTLNTRVKVVGWACVGSGILMYGSTFPALIDAWRMMSTDNIPLPLILAGLANTTLWLTTGVLENNMFMLVQNGCGLFLVTLQLGVYILIWICNRSPPTASERAPPTAANDRAPPAARSALTANPPPTAQSPPTAASESTPPAANDRAPPAARSALTANPPPTAQSPPTAASESTPPAARSPLTANPPRTASEHSPPTATATATATASASASAD